MTDSTDEYWDNDPYGFLADPIDVDDSDEEHGA